MSLGARLPKPGALLFDMGGVLLESADSWDAASFPRSFPQGLPEDAPLDWFLDVSRRILDAYFGLPDPRPSMDPRPIIAEALARRGFEPYAEAVERWYAIVAQWEVRPLYPFVAGTLRTLHAEGYRLGLISNVLTVQDGHRALFRDAGIHDLFEVMVFSSEFGLNKPSPSIFSHALERMGIAADCAWYIGDKPHRDVCGAHATGMTAVLVDSAYHHRIADAPENAPDLTIPDISHLPACLRRMASELG